MVSKIFMESFEKLFFKTVDTKLIVLLNKIRSKNNSKILLKA